MSGGYRTQFKIHGLEPGEIPIEGEPIWDPIGRKLGFWDFTHSEITWFRVPKYGESESYIPKHRWSGTKLQFQEADGTWGDAVDLYGGYVDNITMVRNNDNSYTFKFFMHDGEGNKTFSVTTEPMEELYSGTWDATNNSPNISSGQGKVGQYYIVDVAGTTDVDGINAWNVGDQIRFNGTIWQRIAVVAPVTSVNGKTGDVTIDSSDIYSVATPSDVTDGSSNTLVLTPASIVNVSNQASIAYAEIDYASPYHYGAKGNGIDDDSAALKAAAESGKYVRLGAGTFKVESTSVWELPSPTKLVGASTSLIDSTTTILSTLAATAISVNQGYVSFENIAFKGPGSSVSGSQALLFQKSTNTDNCRVEILGCYFADFSSAIRHYGRSITAFRNTFENCNMAIRRFWPSSDTTSGTLNNPPWGWRGDNISFNKAYDVNYLVYVTDGGLNNYRDAIISQNILETGNTIFYGGGNNLIISQNIAELISGTYVGIYVNSGGSNCIVSHNILNGGGGDPIVDEGHTGIRFSSTGDIENTQISNNRISNTGTYSGIWISAANNKRLQVSNNIINNVQAHGIHLNGNSVDCEFSGGNISDIGQDSAPRGCIAITDGTHNRLRILGIGMDPIISTGKAIYATSATLSNSIIQNNISTASGSIIQGSYVDGGGNTIQS